MKKWFFLVIWIGVTGIIWTFLWKIKPDVGQINSPKSKTLQTTLTPTAKPNKITIAAVGDISLAREVNYQIYQQNNPTYPFEKIASTIKRADLAMANLESPLIDNCPIIRSGFKFCGENTNVEGLTFAGFNTLNLANNHAHNYGIEGYQETKEILTQNNLSYFDNQTIDYQNVKGIKLRIIGFDDTVSRINKEILENKINEAKQNSDLVIVNFHWGEEYQTEPNQRQVDLAHFSIDKGADIIIGHHPHVVQPLRYYQDKPIFYSLGNFIFDQMWSEETKTGAIGFIEIENGEIIETKLEKTYMSDCCQPEPIAK